MATFAEFTSDAGRRARLPVTITPLTPDDIPACAQLAASREGERVEPWITALGTSLDDDRQVVLVAGVMCERERGCIGTRPPGDEQDRAVQDGQRPRSSCDPVQAGCAGGQANPREEGPRIPILHDDAHHITRDRATADKANARRGEPPSPHPADLAVPLAHTSAAARERIPHRVYNVMTRNT